MNRHAHGAILVGDRVVADTIQCCHCGCHYQPIPGSGATRGWCLHCAAPTCGEQPCAACKPLEQWLQDVEARWQKIQRTINGFGW